MKEVYLKSTCDVNIATNDVCIMSNILLEIEELRNTPKKMGIIIQEARVAIGLSQAQLAEMVGCDATLIGKYESGDRTVSAKHLAVICHCTDIRFVIHVNDDFVSDNVKTNLRLMQIMPEIRKELSDFASQTYKDDLKTARKKRDNLVQFNQRLFEKEMEPEDKD